MIIFSTKNGLEHVNSESWLERSQRQTVVGDAASLCLFLFSSSSVSGLASPTRVLTTW